MILFNSSTATWAWLSNFSPHGVTDKNDTYWPTAEHAYQAMKFPLGDPYCVKPGDPQQKILDCVTAANAKALANTLRHLVRKDWGDIKLDVMLRILRAKFQQHKALARKLLDTGSQELVHDCPWGDVYWGVCKGIGHNHMGKILMQVRHELQSKAN